MASISSASVGDDGELKQDGLEVPWNLIPHPFFGSASESIVEEIDEFLHRTKADSRAFVIALTGGSVAQHAFPFLESTMPPGMRSLPALAERDVHFLRLALGTWKQPQQVSVLAYYLAMGGKLDVLVNLDGHNELVDTARNYRNGLHLSYPWLWYQLSSNIVDMEEVREVGAITFLRSLRSRFARLFSRTSHSITACVLWDSVDRFVGRRIDRLATEVSEVPTGGTARLPVFRTGPANGDLSEEEMYTRASLLWMHGSLQLDKLARGADALYLHFLQPNQYVPNSKPLTAEEMRHAIDPSHTGVRLGYPLLLQRGERLREQGVNFASLTGLFEDEQGTIYIDRCCHMNDRGRELLAARITSEIFALLSDSRN